MWSYSGWYLKAAPGQTKTGRPPVSPRPEYDHIYPDIVERLGDAAFFFFSMQRKWMSDRFEARLRTTFSARGHEFDAHCHMLGWQPPERFRGILKAADACLDTIG